MRSGIYKIENLINGKIYIGSSVNIDKRSYHHRNLLKRGIHDNQHLQQSYNKHGKENFKFQTICYCLPEECIEFEQFFIDLLNPEYNICRTAGNTLGYRHTEETKVKLSKMKTGLTQTKEHILKRVSKTRGRFVSNETRRKMSLSAKGRKMSDESKLKLSISKTGSRAWNKGKKMGDLYRGGKPKRPVLQLNNNGDLIKEWESLSSVSSEGFISSCVRRCCIKERKTHKGFKWEFKFL